MVRTPISRLAAIRALVMVAALFATLSAARPAQAQIQLPTRVYYYDAGVYNVSVYPENGYPSRYHYHATIRNNSWSIPSVLYGLPGPTWGNRDIEVSVRDDMGFVYGGTSFHVPLLAAGESYDIDGEVEYFAPGFIDTHVKVQLCPDFDPHQDDDPYNDQE